MAQARRWLWGLIPLAVLWLVAIRLETGPTEHDILSRARSAVAETKGTPAKITARGRDILFGGESFDATDHAAAVAAAEALPGVRRVLDRSRLAAEAKPYVWSAARNDSGVTLTGDMPNPGAQSQIAGKAKELGRVADTTRFARGAPAGFEAVAALGLAQLAGLAHGKAEITGTVLKVSGAAKDAGTREAILAALKTLPPGFSLDTSALTAPFYDFTATSDPAAGTLTLEGTVPDEATRAKLRDAAASAFAGLKVVDNTKVGAGAPAGFAESAGAGLEQLSRLDKGKLALSDKGVTLTGTALYPKAVEQIKGALGALPAGFSGKVEIDAAPPAAGVDAAACQQLFADLLGKGKIRFETASAKIDKRSAGLLDHLVAIALRCPTQALEISGHTDASGSDQTNMDLSKRRAQAVVDYLVAASLDARHLTAVGYGKTKPIAPNDTPDGMAKNRRIEFLVK